MDWSFVSRTRTDSEVPVSSNIAFDPQDFDIISYEHNYIPTLLLIAGIQQVYMRAFVITSLVMAFHSILK